MAKKRYYRYRFPRYLEREAKRKEYRLRVLAEHSSVVLFEGNQEKDVVITTLKASGYDFILDTVNGRRRALVCGIIEIPGCDTIVSDSKQPNTLRT